MNGAAQHSAQSVCPSLDCLGHVVVVLACCIEEEKPGKNV